MDIQLIEVKSEIGAGTRGASLGIDAIKIAALDFRSFYFRDFSSIEIKNENHLLLESFGSPYARRARGIITMYDRVSSAVKKTLESNKFPIVLSGDHSSAGGTIAGIKMAYPQSRIGVVWIDAHADLHSPYTTPSGNMHGMPLAISLGEDNKANKINNPDESSLTAWNELKNLGGICPKIDYDDLVFICLRDYESQEDQIIKKNKIKVVPVSEIRKKGTEKIGREVLSYLDSCDYIYLSFDVDSMDSSISKGTGTPVPHGINEREAGDLIVRLLHSDRVCCFEITEVNPTLDKENLMAENVFEILQKATNEILID